MQIIFSRVNLAHVLILKERKTIHFLYEFVFQFVTESISVTVVFAVHMRIDSMRISPVFNTPLVAVYATFTSTIHPIFICFSLKNVRFALELAICLVFLADNHLGFRSKINDSYGFISNEMHEKAQL